MRRFKKSSPTNQTKHPLYSRWQGLRARCNNPKDSGYLHYGAKGVQFCDKWATDFFAFVEDVGMPPHPKARLKRIDKRGNYEPGNTKWVIPPSAATPPAPAVQYWTPPKVVFRWMGWTLFYKEEEYRRAA